MKPREKQKNPGRFRARAQFAVYEIRAPTIAESAEKVKLIFL
jgi:hypothetical protein